MKHYPDKTTLGQIRESPLTLQNGLVLHHTFGRVNLLEQNNVDWRDPDNWYNIGSTTSIGSGVSWDSEKGAIKFSGVVNRQLNAPIKVDVDKRYVFRFSIMIGDRSAENPLCYMGGHGVTSSGSKYTQNYDYSIISSETLTPWKWYISGNVRTGIDNYKDESANAWDIHKTIGWTGTHGLCDTFWFGGLFNYSGASTDITWIKDIEIYEIPHEDDLLPTKFGAYQHNAVNNLVDPTSTEALGDGLSTSVWGGIELVHSKYKYTDTPHGYRPVVETAFRKKDPEEEGGGVRITGVVISSEDNTDYKMPVTGGKWVCFSRIMRVQKRDYVHGNYLYLRTYREDGTQIHEGGYASKSRRVDLGNGWFWYYSYKKVEADCVEVVLNCYAYEKTEDGNTIQTYAPQVQDNLKWPSFYGAGSYVSQRTLDLPEPLPSWTILGKFTPYSPFKHNTTYTETSPGHATLISPIFKFNDLGLGAPFRYWHPKGSSSEDESTGNSSPFIDLDVKPNVEGSGSHIHQYYEIDAHKPIYYRYWLEGSSLKFQIFQDIKKPIHSGNNSHWSAADFQLVQIEFAHHHDSEYVWEGQHHMVAVYDRVLSEEEFDQFITVDAVLKDNRLLTERVVERPYIPDDAYYNPLDGSSSNLIPREDTTNKMSIGSSCYYTTLTNLSPMIEQWHFKQTPREQVQTPFGIGHKYYDFGGRSEYTFMDIVQAQGSPITIGFWAYVSKDCDAKKVWAAVERNTTSRFINHTEDYDLTKKGTWQFLTRTGVFNNDPAGVKGRYLTYIHGQDGATTISGHIIFTQPTLINKPFPLYEQTTNQGQHNLTHSLLRFNLHEDIGLNWNEEWTICYWKKPLSSYGSHENGLGNYELESIGRNSNSVGNDYKYWGHDNNTTSYAFRGAPSSPNIDLDKYYGLWLFTTLVCKSDGIYLMVYTETGEKVVDTLRSGKATTANAFLTQDGYDLNMNGWDNSNTSTKIIRDLVVVKRALSDDELNQIRRSTFAVMKDSNLSTARSINWVEQ